MYETYEIMKLSFEMGSLLLAVVTICSWQEIQPSYPGGRLNDKKNFADPAIPVLQKLPDMESPSPKPQA